MFVKYPDNNPIMEYSVHQPLSYAAMLSVLYPVKHMIIIKIIKFSKLHLKMPPDDKNCDISKM